ncbi:unnamed protein product [Paramecium sonneborni]|uniref:Uncharacterized protein n=1 Tax=Paramecium sonneborni TaxID=65129 RepID=A0A8S1MFT5_9CILI|nr:unnamed protein product [Paramecium sonneborni]
MEFERITVTKRGLEVQQQLKQILGFKEYKQARTIRKKDQSDNILNKQQEQGICNPDLLEPKVETSEQIQLFLTNRFKNNRQKYIQKDIGNNSQSKKKFGCSFQNETNRSFKYLDFRQMQYLKTNILKGFCQQIRVKNGI